MAGSGSGNLGIHETEAIRSFQNALKRCSRLESLEVLRCEGDTGQQVLEICDLPSFEPV